MTTDLDRIRAKLRSFPPYDWEDEVEELIRKIETLVGERQWILLRTDIMTDALTRIAATQDIDSAHTIARAAQVRVRGEQ